MSHAQNERPNYILLAHYADDTHTVVCHYHFAPECNEVEATVRDYHRACNPKPIRYQLSTVNLSLDEQLAEVLAEGTAQ